MVLNFADDDDDGDSFIHIIIRIKCYNYSLNV